MVTFRSAITGVTSDTVPRSVSAAETQSREAQGITDAPNVGQVTTSATSKGPVEYTYDYYAGTDARVFFNDVWVDDIVTLSWTAAQQKAPIYGFASQFFNAVANGTFIVNGNFSIAFKEYGYLYTILNAIREKASDTDVATIIADAKERRRRESLQASTQAFGPKKRLEPLTIEDWLKGSQPGEKHFEDVASTLEQVIWGESSVTTATSSPGAPLIRKISRQRLPRADELDRKENPTKVGRIGRGFDIIITYGDPNAGGSKDYTVKSILDVHLTGHSQNLAPDGSPIGEVYSFFAKSIDERVSR